jgi:hypothetical protein
MHPRSPTSKRVLASAISAAISGVTAAAAFAQPVFPGAEGYGGTFTGTRPAAGWFSTAQVYRVTTTADTINAATGKPAIGTLRGAFYDYTNPNSPKQNASNRIVVFDVGGVFQLTQGTLDIKTVNNIYIAGQTAPSPVVVYGNTTQITKSNNTMTSNVVMRYMTFRRGSAVTGNTDSITFAGGSGAGDTIATNMIIDHVTATWGTDENLSVTNNNTNVTVQYSMIADALRTDHAYGSLIRPQVDASVSLHHNLYANNTSRQARFGTYNAAKLTADFRNNVVYNWRDRASYTGGSSEPEQEFSDVNYVGNYLVAGAGTLTNANLAYSVDKNVDSRVYQTGNFIDSDKAVNPGGVPNGSDLGWAAFQVSTPITDQTLTQMASAFPTASVTTQAAPDAYTQVVNHVGNYWWNRDAIDSRIINNVKTNTGPLDGLGATGPNAGELAAMLATPTVSRPAGFDTDGDGMPDTWELQRGLNPNSAADGKLDYDSDLYTNVEEYINELGAFPAPAPIVFTGSLSSRYARIENWNIPFQPSRFDTVHINSGTAVIDAIGQDAKDIRIGASAVSGATPTLSITSGWLDARGDVSIGQVAGTNCTLSLTGGKLRVAGTIAGGEATSGVFTFAGGTLVAGAIDATKLRPTAATSALGTFVQNGATSQLAPGDSGTAGRTTITGNYTLQSGSVRIELGAAAPASSFQSATPAFDVVSTSGTLALQGGTISLALLSSYDPQRLVRHLIMPAGSVSGAFATVSGHQIAANKWLAVTYGADGVSVTATTPGDADVNGTVDFDDLLRLAASYNAAGTQTWSTGDFTGDGQTNFDDLLQLASFYNITLSGDAFPYALAVVPEPATAAIMTAACGLALARWRR